jgi:hypothetical protein
VAFISSRMRVKAERIPNRPVKITPIFYAP